MKGSLAECRARLRGFTLIEACLSLAITSTLLIALSSAFHASASAVQENDARFRCTNSARLALRQMTTEIRRADAVQVDPSGCELQIIRPADQLDAGEIYRQFSYDAAQRRITLQIFYAGNISGPLCEVAEGVSACTFHSAKEGSAQSSRAGLCVSILITCSDGGDNVTLAGSASPRRAYNPGP